MNYNFDELIDRRGTGAEKVEGMKSIWGRSYSDVGSRYGFCNSTVCD
jgi:hypothetical protein